MAEETEKTDPGFVYVVHMEGLPVYKIGRSVDVPRRMSEFGILLPFPYQLVFARRTERVHWAESVLHDEYAHRRCNGEWFELVPAELERVNHLLLYWQATETFTRLLYLVTRAANEACAFHQTNKQLPDPSYMGSLGVILFRASRRVERRQKFCEYSYRSAHSPTQEVEGLQ